MYRQELFLQSDKLGLLGQLPVWLRGKALFIAQLRALIRPARAAVNFGPQSIRAGLFCFWLTRYLGKFLPVFFLVQWFYLFLSQFASGFIFHLQNFFKFKVCSVSNFVQIQICLTFEICSHTNFAYFLKFSQIKRFFSF
jgi:hypothetical protein